MSENLRKKVHELLVRTMNELKEMFDAVNLSMNRRVMETSEAKKTLTDHLKRVWIKNSCISWYSSACAFHICDWVRILQYAVVES